MVYIRVIKNLKNEHVLNKKYFDAINTKIYIGFLFPLEGAMRNISHYYASEKVSVRCMYFKFYKTCL